GSEDADDNNAFHAKQIVMDIERSLSTEVAIIKDEQAYYHDRVTMRLALSNDGKPVPVEQGSLCGRIPKGAKAWHRGRSCCDGFIGPLLAFEVGRRVAPATSRAAAPQWGPSRKLLMTVAIVAIALAPSIGIG